MVKSTSRFFPTLTMSDQLANQLGIWLHICTWKRGTSAFRQRMLA